MKKLLFTALAVVAFSVASMANTVEVKEVPYIENNLENQAILGDCEDAQTAAFNECRSNGCSYWDSYYFGARAWGDCMAELSF
jgi:hypothetical protein